MPEVYLGLKTGSIDGQENPLSILSAAKLYEVCRVSMSATNSGIEMYYTLQPREQEVYLQELCNMVIAYLRLYL